MSDNIEIEANEEHEAQHYTCPNRGKKIEIVQYFWQT